MDLAQPHEAHPAGRLHHTSAGADAVALAHLIAEGRLAPDIAVTCRNRTDGAGAQAAATISALVLSRFARCRYLHSPFRSIAHAIGNLQDWAQRWEHFFNLGDGEATVPPDAKLVSLAAVVRDPEGHAKPGTVIGEHLFGLPPGVVAPVKDALRSELRIKYWRSPKTAIPSHRGASDFTVAIHLRRGDVSENRNANRYVGDDHLLRQVARLQVALVPFGRPITLNLYSEGTAHDFRIFADAGCHLHIGGDPFDSFHNMVAADILLTAPGSAFSGTAGLLSRGIVLDHQIHSSRLSDWLHRRADGDIPIKRLRRALLGRMDWIDRGAYQVGRGWQRLRFGG